MLPVWTVAAVLLWLAGAQSLHAQATSPFDAHVERVRRAFDVPGIALAVVKDGRVVMAKGYGDRAVGGTAPVTEHTLFPIASNSKAFTAAALVMLAEEKRLHLDSAVANYLPGFQLADSYASRHASPRDLLAHRSGLGTGVGDLLWWPPSNYSRQEIVQRIRYLPFPRGFRSGFAYSNVTYLAAGELIAAVSGESWESFVARRIFEPIGMSESLARYPELNEASNIAAAHARMNGRMERIPPFLADNLGPAGGIFSTAADMAKWLLFLTDSGRVGGAASLLRPQARASLWTMATPIPVGPPPPELAPLRFNFLGSGLGFLVQDYRGQKMVSHSGMLPGYVSRVTLLPDQRLGLVVLTNAEVNEALEAITFHILDYFLKSPGFDWVGALRQQKARSDSIVQEAERRALRRPASPAPLSLMPEAFAGQYLDRWYGAIDIALEQGTLVMRFARTPALVGELEHWQHDTFVVRWRDRSLRADAFISFALNPDGTIAQARMRPTSPTIDFSYDFQDLLILPTRSTAR